MPSEDKKKKEERKKRKKTLKVCHIQVNCVHRPMIEQQAELHYRDKEEQQIEEPHRDAHITPEVRLEVDPWKTKLLHQRHSQKSPHAEEVHTQKGFFNREVHTEKVGGHRSSLRRTVVFLKEGEILEKETGRVSQAKK